MILIYNPTSNYVQHLNKLKTLQDTGLRLFQKCVVVARLDHLFFRGLVLQKRHERLNRVRTQRLEHPVLVDHGHLICAENLQILITALLHVSMFSDPILGGDFMSFYSPLF